MELKFQEMRIDKPLRAPRNGLEAMFMSPGPSVTLSPRVAKPYARLAIANELDQQIRLLRSRIEAIMPSQGGVIVRVGVHVAKTAREDSGTFEQRLLQVEIVGSGPVALTAATVAVPSLSRLRRAPRGWCSKSLYVWVTR